MEPSLKTKQKYLYSDEKYMVPEFIKLEEKDISMLYNVLFLFIGLQRSESVVWMFKILPRSDRVLYLGKFEYFPLSGQSIS